ncbi:MAG: aspartate--ammonia ligase [Oscillospiraceae bacterium]
MEATFIPHGYTSCLGLYDTQKAIGIANNTFEKKLCAALHLKRVTAPLFVDALSGLNDNLSGVERPVSFDVPSADAKAEVVHSLAKWKRMALADYGFHVGNGLVTNMNAIRRDEDMDNLHSIYVDQWDWEKVISKDDRTAVTLKDTVRRIVGAICSTLEELKWQFQDLDTALERDVHFITSEALLQKYPTFTPKERENAIAKEYKTVFIIGIGDNLSNGEPHDKRAPDYDDWNLNGDLLFWHEPLQRAVEISSMGIRVNEASMSRQLQAANCTNRAELPFHKRLLNGELPLTIGGGIGQSRLCMLWLGKVHVGEVQVSIWDNKTIEECAKAGVKLL